MLRFDGTKLRKLRQQKGLKQRELALLVGKKTADISNYENGIARPTPDTLLNLMAFFQVGPSGLGANEEVSV